MALWDSELTPDQTEELLDRAEREIRKRRLQTPAILFLEMHKPLSFVASQAALVFSPFMIPFVGFDAVDGYTQLFSKRENVEALIVRLEQPETKEASA